MTSWLSAIRGFNRNAYLLFFTGVLGFTYWGITYLLTNIFLSPGWATAPRWWGT